MNLYYGLYPVDTDVSDFIANAYQAELILRLATKPEMGWYARNMSELQSPNRNTSFTGSTRHLITQQATSWTQQLYKDKHARVAAQRYNHSDPYTLSELPPSPIQWKSVPSVHLDPLAIPCSCMGIVFISVYIDLMSISSLPELDQTRTSRQHFGIWERFYPIPLICITWEMVLFELSSTLFSINMMTIHAVSPFTLFRHQTVNHMNTP